MMKAISIQRGYFLGFIVILLMVGFVFFLQSRGVLPCPLCLLQRMMMMALSVVFFIGMLWPFKRIGNSVLGVLGMAITVGGMLLAGRQVWLQYLPPMSTGGCGVNLQYLLSILPFTDVMKIVWQGGTECSALGWVFLHLSLAEWSLVAFGGFFIFVLVQFKRGLAQP